MIIFNPSKRRLELECECCHQRFVLSDVKVKIRGPKPIYCRACAILKRKALLAKSQRKWQEKHKNQILMREI